MITAAEHPMEQLRLKVLEDTGLFNNEYDGQYDHFVSIASAIAQTPISLLSLVDAKRQWFRAKVGIKVTETPRNVAFCAHAILNEHQPLIVENALFDMRFCDNPLVVDDPGIRFYAGVPLCVSDQAMPIGTICVIDRQPRSLSASQVEALVALGKVAEMFINNSVEIQKLQRFNEALLAAPVAKPVR